MQRPDEHTAGLCGEEGGDMIVEPRELVCWTCMCINSKKNPITIVNEEMICLECMSDKNVTNHLTDEK